MTFHEMHCRMSGCVSVESMLWTDSDLSGYLPECWPFSLEACRSGIADADIDRCSDTTERFTFPGNVNCCVHISVCPVLSFHPLCLLLAQTHVREAKV